MRRKPIITRTHLFFGAICLATFLAETAASSLGWRSSSSVTFSALFLPIFSVCAAKSATPLQAYSIYQDEVRVVAEDSLSKKKEIEEGIQTNVASLLKIKNKTDLLDGFKTYLDRSEYPKIAATISLIKVLGSNLHYHVQEFLLKSILTFDPYLNYPYWLGYKNEWVNPVEYALDRRNVMGLKILLETGYFQDEVARAGIAEGFKADITHTSEAFKNLSKREGYLGDMLNLGEQNFHVPYSFREKLCAAMDAVAQHLYASRTLLLEPLNTLASLLSSLSPGTHALSNPYFSLEASYLEAQIVVRTKNLEMIREYISNKPTALQSEAAGLVILASNFVDGKPSYPDIIELAFSFNPILDLVHAGKSMLGYAANLLDVRTTLRLLHAGAEFIDSEVPLVSAMIVKYLQEGPESISLFYRNKNGSERTLFALDRQLLRQTFTGIKASLEAGMRASFPRFVMLAEKFLEYLDISDPYAQEKMRVGAVDKSLDDVASCIEYFRKMLQKKSPSTGYVGAENKSGYPLEVYAQLVGSGNAPMFRIAMLYEEHVHQIWSSIVEKSIFQRTLTDEEMKFRFFDMAKEFYPFSRGLTQQILTANVGEMKAMVENASNPQHAAKGVLASMIDARNFTYAESEELFQFLGNEALTEAQESYVHRSFFLDMSLRLFEFPAALYYAEHFSAFLPGHYRDTLVGVLELLFKLIPENPPEHFSHLSFSFEEENFTFPVTFRPKLGTFITELKRSNIISLPTLKEVVHVLKSSPNTLADEPTKRKKLAKKLLSAYYISHPDLFPPSETRDPIWMEKTATFFSYAIRFPQNIFFTGVIGMAGWLGWKQYRKAHAAKMARQKFLQTMAKQKEKEGARVVEMEEKAHRLLEKTGRINLSEQRFEDLQILHDEVEKFLLDVKTVAIDTTLFSKVKALEKRLTPIYSAKRPKQVIPAAIVSSGTAQSIRGEPHVSEKPQGSSGGAAAARSESKKERREGKKSAVDAGGAAAVRRMTDQEWNDKKKALFAQSVELNQTEQEYLDIFIGRLALIAEGNRLSEERDTVMSRTTLEAHKKAYAEFKKEIENFIHNFVIKKEQLERKNSEFAANLDGARKSAGKKAGEISHLQAVDTRTLFREFDVTTLELQELVRSIDSKEIQTPLPTVSGRGKLTFIQPRGEEKIDEAAGDAEELEEITGAALAGVERALDDEWNETLAKAEAENFR